MKFSIKRQIAVYSCFCLIFYCAQRKSMAMTLEGIEEFVSNNSIKSTAFIITFSSCQMLKELVIDPIKTYVTNNLLERRKQSLQIEQQRLVVYEKHTDKKISDDEQKILLKNLDSLRNNSKTDTARIKSQENDIKQLKDGVKQLKEDTKQLKDIVKQLKDKIDAFGNKLDTFLPQQIVQQTQTINHGKQGNP